MGSRIKWEMERSGLCYLTVLLAAQRDANPNAPNEQVTEKLGQQTGSDAERGSIMVGWSVTQSCLVTPREGYWGFHPCPAG